MDWNPNLGRYRQGTRLVRTDETRTKPWFPELGWWMAGQRVDEIWLYPCIGSLKSTSPRVGK
jgi:hypothetical protein